VVPVVGAAFLHGPPTQPRQRTNAPGCRPTPACPASPPNPHTHTHARAHHRRRAHARVRPARRCSLLCSQSVAIVARGRCGACAPGQLPGGFPFCAAGDRTGVAPVCGTDGVTYRNSLAAQAAGVAEAAAGAGTCAATQCSLEVSSAGWRCVDAGSGGIGSGCTPRPGAAAAHTRRAGRVSSAPACAR
jgi:hypothetical protein